MSSIYEATEKMLSHLKPQELTDEQYDLLVDSTAQLSKTARELQELVDSLDRKIEDIEEEKERWQENIDQIESLVSTAEGLILLRELGITE